ncbi:MAG TPA: hypothetical protein VJQ50_07495, partial [Terriglobales bacterium]|nr:hypothetical protein [Terriglobales bacterium]
TPPLPPPPQCFFLGLCDGYGYGNSVCGYMPYGCSNQGGVGIPSGGGGGGGTPNQQTQPQTPTPSRAVCAANLADKYSIAGALGTTNKTGFFPSVFNGVAGNTVSGVVMMFNGGNKWRAVTSINNVTFQGTTTAINAVTTPAPITELGLTETVGGEFLGKGLGGIFTAGKLLYDIGSFTAAYYSSACKGGG